MTTDIQSALGRGLHVKLAEVVAAVDKIDKTGTAPEAMGGFSFVEARVLAEKARKELSARQLTMVPESVTRLEGSVFTTSGGRSMFLEHVHVLWRITDGESGESCVVESIGSGSDVGDKAIPKALTNAMKYALLIGLLVPQGDDPERGGGLGDGETPVGRPHRTGGSAAPASNPVCECGERYRGRPGDYWHRAQDGSIHRPAGQRRPTPA